MLGTIVNAVAIVVGGLLGVVLRGGLPDGYRKIMLQAVGLAVLLVGLRGAFASDDLILVIVSLVVGGVVGQALQIEGRLEALGQWCQNRLVRSGGDFARGFVTASLVFCVGSMAIVGSLESGLTGSHQTLFAKSILDGITSIIFASTFGIGVVLSAVPVFLYQGGITVGAGWLKPLLVGPVEAQMSAVGGVLIIGIGINLLEIQKIRVGNLLPAIAMPILYTLLLRCL